MKKLLKLAIVPAICSVTLGCNWVQLTDEGAGVRLAESTAVSNCRRVGASTSQTMSRVTVVERGSEKMQEELVTLARNEAGTMGGNVIVPETVIEEGRQRFGVYACP
ncbi:MAG: DUF4156 domain-containing protein [Pseudohongiellaceae bacterium]